MKTLNEIINSTKKGGKPDYDELRYAIVALDALSFFDGKAIRDLRIAEEEGKRKILLYDIKWQHDEHFRRWKVALGKSPKEYVGWNNDPDNPNVRERIAMSNRIVDKLLKKG